MKNDALTVRPLSSIFFPLLLIYAIGIIMIFDASSGEIVDCARTKSQFSALYRQLTWGGCATIAFLSAWGLGWKRTMNISPFLYGMLIVALILVLIPHVGICANGSRRWLGWHGVYVQPSEFVKIILPAFFFHACSRYKKIFTHFRSFLILMAQVAASVLLIILEPNNGTAGVIILLIGVSTLLVGIPMRFWFIPLCIIMCGLVLFAANSNYVQKRIESYLNPELDIRGKGHQPYQAKIAAGSGGLFGKGPAKSIQKLSYLPEAQNDYIAAIFAEEYGFLGITCLIALYSWFFIELWKIVCVTEVYAAFGWGMTIYFLLFIQTFMNLGIVSGLLPSSGLNLPFLSQGGSSLVANAMGVGFIMSMQNK